MKKILSIILAILLMFTSVLASANVPEFLTKIYDNYTADYSVSVSFNSGEDIVALLEELGMLDTISTYVDLKPLLQSLFTYDSKMKLQADFSDNYNKIKVALTSESAQDITVNPNLNFSVNTKAGMWIDFDLSNEENPVFDIIYSQPSMNKYFKINAGEFLDEETVGLFKSLFNKELIESVNKTTVDLFAKNAVIKGSGTRYTVTMDNEGFTSYIDEIISYMSENIMQDYEEYNPYSEFPSTKGWQILGKDGIQCSYSLRGTTIATETVKADILLDISKIYTSITGEEWMYDATGTLDFTIDISANVSKIGTTKVEFPVLTDENSVSMNDLIPDYDYGYEEYPPVPPYPMYYVNGSANTLPVIDGNVYVPLRTVLERAYVDSVTIDYNNGVITAASEYFPGFKNLSITIGSDKIYTDGVEHTVGTAILTDGTTYVNSNMFCDVFGWDLAYAEYDLIDNYFSYAFYTNRY